MFKTDILVIGSGLAGAVAAVTAADLGKKVTVLTKMFNLLSGNTPYAQGGIIYKGLTDTPDKLKKDIMVAGAGHCWEKAVDELCRKGPSLVEKLLIDRFHVRFDKNENDCLDLTAEGAHSEARIIHTRDHTGENIQKAAIKVLGEHPNIECLTEHTVVDLLTLSHHSKNSLDIYEKPACFGAFVLNNQTGNVFPILASRIILATGGLGQIYLHTSNPIEATGDGIALAWRAGVRCMNLQYIQFHPTAFYGKRDRFLISESMRGEGAVLVDVNGRDFMKKLHDAGSLAPRDIVARGIHQTILETAHPCVYLDISFKDSAWIKNRFPTIYTYCLKEDIDICHEPIPVVPVCHYLCGGVGVNLNGRSSLRRLYAVGEVSCTGVHGANRLASTSLLESVVWGHAAGKDSAETCRDDDYFPDIYDWESENEYIDPALIAQDWLTIKNTMWNYVGLVKTRQRLDRARTILRHLQSEIDHFYQKAKLTRSLLELRNGVQTAIAVTCATIETRNNKGAHYMVDDG